MIWVLYPFVAVAMFLVTVVRLLCLAVRCIPLRWERKPRIIEMIRPRQVTVLMEREIEIRIDYERDK